MLSGTPTTYLVIATCWFTLSEILHVCDMLEAKWHKESPNTSLQVSAYKVFVIDIQYGTVIMRLIFSQIRTINIPYIYICIYILLQLLLCCMVWNMLWIKRVIATPRWNWKSHERVVLESRYKCVIAYRLYIQSFVGDKNKNIKTLHQVQVFYIPQRNTWYDLQFACSSFLEGGWTEKHSLSNCLPRYQTQKHHNCKLSIYHSRILNDTENSTERKTRAVNDCLIRPLPASVNALLVNCA